MTAQLGGRYAAVVNNTPRPGLFGVVDMHVHPAAHLGFGGQLIYGAPDGDPARELANCNTFHGGIDLLGGNPGGNVIRAQVSAEIEAEGRPADLQWTHERTGWPSFHAWPSWHDRLHQQARVEHLHRAWQGGLRVIVALAVNSHLLATATQTDGVSDDRTSGDRQISHLDKMAANAGFMQVVRTAAELRRCVGEGQLAVVLGVELDAIGNFYQPTNDRNAGAPFQPQPSPTQVMAEIDRLYAAGVRYFFPVHVVDNVLGGTALYEPTFVPASRFMNGGAYPQAEAVDATSHIGYHHSNDMDALPALVAAVTTFLPPNPFPPAPPATTSGHRNSRGLTDLGRVAVRHLMNRRVLIDIDHMSERCAADVLAMARRRGYPLVAGHNAIRETRPLVPGTGPSERQHTLATLRQMYELGGLLGVGLADGADNIPTQLRALRGAVPDAVVGVGSDATGMEHLPRPRHTDQAAAETAPSRQQAGLIVYQDHPGADPNALQRCRFGDRSYDYSRDGMAHLGLLPDMLEELHIDGLLSEAELSSLFDSAERFTSTWQRAEQHTPWQTLDTNPGSVQIVADGDQLFQRHADGGIWRYTGTPLTGWAQLDNNPGTVDIVAGGGRLYQRHADGSIWVFTGTAFTGWQTLDTNPGTVQIVADGDQLFQRHADGGIWRYTGTPLTGWAQLDNNPGTVDIVAGGGRLYQRHADGSIWVFTGTAFTGWQTLDTNPGTVQIVADGGELYQRHADGGIWRYTGTPLTGWAQLDNNSTCTGITAAAGDLYQTHGDADPGTWQYTGTAYTGWVNLDHRSIRQLASAPGRLYQLLPDGTITRDVTRDS